MSDARPDTADRSFAAYLTATDRDQLDARAAAAEQERDEALDARDVLRVQLDAANADVTRLKQHLVSEQERLRGHIARARDERDEIAAKHADAHRLAAFRKGVIDRHRQELGAAGEVLAVVRDAAERIERALAVYDTTPGEPTEREDTPHEDPARLREQLAEAHADCARYATERDEARAALANPLHKAAEHLRLLAEDHGLDSLGFGIGWAADALDAWAKTPDEAAPPASVPPRRMQEDDLRPVRAAAIREAIGAVAAHGPGVDWMRELENFARFVETYDPADAEPTP